MVAPAVSKGFITAVQIALSYPPARKRVVAILEHVAEQLRVGDGQKLLGVIEAILAARAAGRRYQL